MEIRHRIAYLTKGYDQGLNIEHLLTVFQPVAYRECSPTLAIFHEDEMLRSRGIFELLLPSSRSWLDFVGYWSWYSSVARVEHADNARVGEATQEFGFFFGNVTLLPTVDGGYFENVMVCAGCDAFGDIDVVVTGV